MPPHCSEFAFPNDGQVLWSLMIVIYPYLSGIVAGTFVVSSYFYVFRRAELRPIARLGLVSSLGFLLAAPLPLLFHLGHPLRGLYVLVTPNFSSAMSAFGYVYALFAILLSAQIWLVYRRTIVARAQEGPWLPRAFYRVLALGVDDIGEASLEVDRRLTVCLASLGIPVGCVLTGYVGFIFGSVKANYWWSTTLMPVIFVLSGVLSGFALVIVLYLIGAKLARQRVDRECVLSLTQTLWLFLIATVVLEGLEIVVLAYEKNEEWLVVEPLLFGSLKFSFWGLQMLLGSLVPFAVLGVTVTLGRRLHAPLGNWLSFLCSLIVLMQVFAMRWNVVIGGQMFSKSMGGFRETYVPDFFEKEGIAVAIAILLVPFAFVTVFSRFLPALGEPEEPGTEGTTAAEVATMG